jgi:hypothetical protein
MPLSSSDLADHVLTFSQDVRQLPRETSCPDTDDYRLMSDYEVTLVNDNSANPFVHPAPHRLCANQ